MQPEKLDRKRNHDATHVLPDQPPAKKTCVGGLQRTVNFKTAEELFGITPLNVPIQTKRERSEETVVQAVQPPKKMQKVKEGGISRTTQNHQNDQPLEEKPSSAQTRKFTIQENFFDASTQSDDGASEIDDQANIVPNEMYLEEIEKQNLIIEKRQKILELQQLKLMKQQEKILLTIAKMERGMAPLDVEKSNTDIIEVDSVYDQKIKLLFKGLICSSQDTKIIVDNAALNKKVSNEKRRILTQLDKEQTDLRTLNTIELDYSNLKYPDNTILSSFQYVTLATQEGTLHANEDRYGFFTLEISTPLGKQKALCLSIFDGHGGKEASEFCQLHIKKTLQSCFDILSNTGEDFEIANAMRMSFVHLDASFRQKKLTRPGCTAILALYVNKRLFVANCGDSRAILIPGDSQKPQQLSYDFKASDVYAQKSLKNKGGVICSIFQYERAQGALAVTRAIGDELFRDKWGHNPITPLPNITVTDLSEVNKEGMRLLLCCDGLTDAFTTQGIAKIVSDLSGKNIENSKRKLHSSEIITFLIGEARRKNVKDDITIGIIDIDKLN